MKQEKGNRNKKQQPEPNRPISLENDRKKAYQNTWIKPYDIKVPSHLQMVGEEIEKYHKHCKDGKTGVDSKI